MDNYTSRLADGVWRIEVGPFTNAYLIAADGHSDRDGLTLVDTGVRRSGPRLVRSVRLLGLDPRRITDVALTHWHTDHMGSAARFTMSSATPEVLVGRRDLPAVNGTQPRPYDAAAAADVTWLGRRLAAVITPGPAVASPQPLDDGDVLPRAPRAVVVDSPGHTLGHISLHLPDDGVLLAGDVVSSVGTFTRGFGFTRCALTHEARTLERLSRLEFDVLAPGHGPPVVKGAQSRLARLAQRAAAARPPSAA
ncbi:MAG: MBL fold metallo-hydrolase [Nitriliruptorales bacterium]|nr:MBL fold metallo-hydrolase [Nitriliruptorales bacterium]